jgi:RNA-binding protein YhbY
LLRSSWKTINLPQKSPSNLSVEGVARQVRHQSATIHIGKNGITEMVNEELKRQVEKHKAVKVHILRNCPIEPIDKVFLELQTSSGVKLWRKSGRTAIFIEDQE